MDGINLFDDSCYKEQETEPFISNNFTSDIPFAL